MTGLPDDKSAAPPVDLNALALRFVGLLSILGGCSLLIVLATIQRFPKVAHDGAWAYAIPGTQHRVIEPAISAVLAGAGGLMVVVGSLSVLAARLRAGRAALLLFVSPNTTREPRRRRSAIVLAIGVAVLVAAIAVRQHAAAP